MLAIAVCVLGLLTAGTQASTEEADSLYVAAMADTSMATVKERIRAMTEVIRADSKHHPAWHELAKLYLSLDTVRGRHHAEQALTHALRLSPDNSVYDKTWAKLLWSQGLYSDAVRKYREMLQENPDNVEALTAVGEKDYQEWDKYRDVYFIDTELEMPAVFTWDHFAEKDRQKAMPYLEAAVEKGPDAVLAYEKLAVLYYERGESMKQRDLGEKLAAQHGRETDGLLMKGLAHQQMEDEEEEAWKAYRKALDHMPEADRRAISSIGALIPDDSIFADGDPDSLDLERYWRQEDPLFLTDYNERTMEHYGRIAYANIRFGQADKGIPGYLTDRGQALMRYGQPRERTATRYGGRTWHYDGFMLGFRGGPKYGDWVFTRAFRHGETPRSDLRAYPPRFVDPYWKHKYSMPHQLASFREGRSIRVEMSWAIPRKWVAQSEKDGFVLLQNGVFAFDERWDPAFREVDETLELPRVGEEAPHTDYLLSEHAVYLEPGGYLLAGEVRDPRTKTIGHFRERRILNEPGPGLAMSDLLLARGITQLSPDPETRADLVIVPDPLATCRRLQPLLIYFEVYGLQKDAYGRTSYDVTYEIGWPEEKDGEAPIGKLMYGAWETSVTSTYEGERVNDLTFLAIDVREAPAGKHQLAVQVTDVNSGKSDERTVRFTLLE